MDALTDAGGVGAATGLGTAGGGAFDEPEDAKYPKIELGLGV